MILIYMPDGTNVYDETSGEFKGSGSVQGLESCNTVFLEGHFLFICSDSFAVGCII